MFLAWRDNVFVHDNLIVLYSIVLFVAENKIVLLEDVTSETEMKLVTAKADGGWEWEGAPFSNRKCFKTPTRRELGIVEISNIDSTSKSKYRNRPNIFIFNLMGYIGLFCH